MRLNINMQENATEGADLLVAASSGKLTGEDGVRLTASESGNDLIRSSYNYLRAHATHGAPLTTSRPQDASPSVAEGGDWQQTYTGEPYQGQPLIGWYDLKDNGLEWRVVTTVSWEKYYSWIWDSGSGFWSSALWATLVGYTIQWALLLHTAVAIWQRTPTRTVAEPLLIFVFICLWVLWVRHHCP